MKNVPKLTFLGLLVPSVLLQAQLTAPSSSEPTETRHEWVERLPQANDLSRPQDRRLQGLYMLNGLYSNEVSIRRDSSQNQASIFEQEALVVIRPIWQEQAEMGESWFYYARVLKQRPERPLYQLVCRFQPLRGDTFAVQTHIIEARNYLSQPKIYQTWADEKPLEGLTLANLSYKTGCDLWYYYDQDLGQYRFQQQENFCEIGEKIGLAQYQFFKVMVDAHSLNVATELYNERKELISPDKFRYYERLKPQAVQEWLWTLGPKEEGRGLNSSKKTAQNLEFKRN